MRKANEGFTDIPKSMIEADFLSPNEFRVLAVLHSYNFLNKIFPAQEELAEKTGLSLPTLWRAITKLAEEGIIIKDQRQTKNGRYSTNEYSFVCGGWNNWYEKRFGKFALPSYKTSVPSKEELETVKTFNIKENPLGFVRCLNELLFTDKLNSNQLRIFLYLKQFANCDLIYPSYATITKKANVSRHTAIDTINSLCELKLMSKIETMMPEGGRGANNYLICNDVEIKEWLK